MITRMKYGDYNDRTEVLEYIKLLVEGGGRVIDIGGATSFADGYLDAIIDIGQPLAHAKHNFIGNINYPDVWKVPIDHVNGFGLENAIKGHNVPFGKWDFAICTHTLEDIANPWYVCEMMSRIAKSGYIAVPSKYWEFGRFGIDTYRGFIHHRWIFDEVDGEFLGFPKINYIESRKFDAICNHPQAGEMKELSLWWSEENPLKIVNNDFLGPTEQDVMNYYDVLLKNK